MSNEIRVVLVDGDPNDCIVIQDLLSDYKRINFVGIAVNSSSFMDVVKNCDPDIAIIDTYVNEDFSGMEILKCISENKYSVKPIIFSSQDNHVLQCYRLGAYSYILKNDWGEIVPTIKKVYQGMRVVPGYTANILLNGLCDMANKFDMNSELSEMSPKESNILNRLVQGDSTRDISDHFGISHFTVKRHLQNIRGKVDVKSTRQLIEKFKERERSLV